MIGPEQTKIAGDLFDPTGTGTLQVIAKADKFNRWMFETIRPYLKGEILEIGSGIGNISKFVIEAGHTISLSDFSRDYHQILRDAFSHYPNVQAVLSIDLQHTEFFNEYAALEGKYDTVFLLNVIEHLASDSAAIENCRFLLKPGGHLIVLAPAYRFLYCGFDKELGHFRRYTLKSLQNVITHHSFDILHKQYFNLIGIAGWFIFGKLLKKKMIGSGEMSVFNKLLPLWKFADLVTFRKAGLSAIVVGKKEIL